MILKYNIYTRTLAPDMLIENRDANFHGVQKKRAVLYETIKNEQTSMTTYKFVWSIQNN